MKSEDDPEARIRELEQPLAETARASEAASDPRPSKWMPPSGPPMPPSPPLPYSGSFSGPPTGMRTPGTGRWIILAVFVIGIMCLPLAIFLFSSHQVSRSGPPTRLPIPTFSSMSPTPSRPVPSTAAPAGENITVSGINEVRTIACNGGSVNVSGITNNVTITGHCAKLNVSGIQNQITVDNADAIQASGSGNHVTYHGGSPEIGKSGFDNVVQKG